MRKNTVIIAINDNLPELIVVLLFGEFDLESAVAFWNLCDNNLPGALDGLGGDWCVGVDAELDTVLKLTLEAISIFAP